MNNPMPKDNEVDEKVMPVAWANPADINCIGFEDSNSYPGIRRHADELHSFPLYSAATVAELRARVDRLAELRANDAAYIKKLDGIIEETGVRPVSCINPYEDLKAVVLALKKRADEADAAERRVGECLTFIDGIRDELHNRRTADWFPEGAHNAAAQMSEDMRLLGNACADFDPYTLTGADPT